MMSILKADLRRMLNLHGNFYGYMVAYLIVVLLMSIGIPMLGNLLNDMAAQSGNTELATDMSGLFASPLAFLSSSLSAFGIVSIFASWCVASFCWSDMRCGFDRTMVSGCGKKLYYLEKLLFALAMSFVFVVIGMVVSLLAAIATVGIAGGSSVVSIVLWCVLLTLICWSCASLTLFVMWITKSHVIAMVAGFTLAAGALSSIVGLFIGSIPTLANVWGEIIAWFPCNAFSRLSIIVDGELALAAMDWAHVLVPSAACLAISFGCALAVLRRRDM